MQSSVETDFQIGRKRGREGSTEESDREDRLNKKLRPGKNKKRATVVQKRQSQDNKHLDQETNIVTLQGDAVNGTRTPVLENKRRKRGQRKRRRSRKRTQNNAVVVKPVGGKTYAEVLGAIRLNMCPDNPEHEIRTIRKTMDGGVLLELGRGVSPGKLKDTIQAAVGESGVVRGLMPRLKVEVFDLDSLTTEQEVTAAVKRDSGDVATGDIKVTLFKADKWEQRKAVIELDELAAKQLLDRGRIRIGWVFGRVRMRVEVKKCYKCQGYGHIRSNCTGPDRSNSCWKCGGSGHKAAECELQAKCHICDGKPGGNNHVQGSSSCETFQGFLRRARGKNRA